ncbi:MAG: methyltransferase domain-containing protein, partial [Anaerolineae bacterium]|nr:methyltransferase domain-containing protein [Anaerolineae bacterium]
MRFPKRTCSITQQQSGELSKNRAAYFDMLADLGMTKHLGSLAATEDLVKGCRINAASLVLDVGCGVGLTPCYLARTYGCDVTGVDITP